MHHVLEAIKYSFEVKGWLLGGIGGLVGYWAMMPRCTTEQVIHKICRIDQFQYACPFSIQTCRNLFGLQVVGAVPAEYYYLAIAAGIVIGAAIQAAAFYAWRQISSS
jgi:hypothetical protein